MPHFTKYLLCLHANKKLGTKQYSAEAIDGPDSRSDILPSHTCQTNYKNLESPLPTITAAANPLVCRGRDASNYRYGTRIDDIPKTGQLPDFLQELFRQLRERGGAVEKVFVKEMTRISHMRYERLKRKLRSGKVTPLSSYKPHILAALLANWTKHQPEAMMGRIQVWSDVVDKLNAWHQAGCYDDVETFDALIMAIKSVISGFPAVMQAFLKSFIGLLHTVGVKNTKRTLLDEQQLAGCLGPVLWNAKQINKEAAKQAKKKIKKKESRHKYMIDEEQWAAAERRVQILEVAIQYADRIFDLESNCELVDNTDIIPTWLRIDSKIQLKLGKPLKATNKLLDVTGLPPHSNAPARKRISLLARGRRKVVAPTSVPREHMEVSNEVLPPNKGNMTVQDLEEAGKVAADVPGSVQNLVVTADVPGSVQNLVVAADVPGSVQNLVVAADVPVPVQEQSAPEETPCESTVTPAAEEKKGKKASRLRNLKCMFTCFGRLVTVECCH
ncbi:PREDICTED: uncharacterized protein LOC106812241 [Priapulus caudatus]|uniref:Uncharacterized protein LOC106812241 n=1 Tax=Priapulus caudatus TaxID=37621 RepID=A0ABM1EH86_PRICU|nr:PREDICTED: uncharacterized protein LOC106812241 [Priapulus caudatus]